MNNRIILNAIMRQTDQEFRGYIKDWNKEQIGQQLVQKTIRWKFNTPAAHFGTVWERLVRGAIQVGCSVRDLFIVNYSDKLQPMRKMGKTVKEQQKYQKEIDIVWKVEDSDKRRYYNFVELQKSSSVQTA